MVRAVAHADAVAMNDAASSDGIEIVPISGYRTPDEQELAFESAVWSAMARSAEGIDRAEAESRMARFVSSSVSTANPNWIASHGSRPRLTILIARAPRARVSSCKV